MVFPFTIDMTTAIRANHSRWCASNPKRNTYNLTNNCSQLRTPSSIAKRIAGIKKAHADGRYVGAPQRGVTTKIQNGTLYHTPETKK